MDLVNCKLISRSKSRIREKLDYYKYWESAGKPRTRCLDPKNIKDKLMGSKSVPRFIQKIYEKGKHKESVLPKSQSFIRGIASKNNFKRLCPLKILGVKEFQDPPWEIPFIITGNPLRNCLKQLVYKAQEEKLSQNSKWNQSLKRSAQIGYKLVKPKSSVREKSRYESSERYERKKMCRNLDSERQIYEYKEPYIQALLKRNPRDFSDLFNNSTNIL